MFGVLVIMAAVIVLEAIFIAFIVKKALSIIEAYEAKLIEMEYGYAEEEKAEAINKTAASVKRVWEGDI